MKREVVVSTLFCVIICLAACSSKDSKNTSPSELEILTTEISEEENDDSEAEFVKESHIYPSIDAKQLLSDLNQNAYSASTKHQGQYYEITGIVDSIDANGEYFVVVSTDDSYEQKIKCTTDDDLTRNGLSTLCIGENVVANGQITNVSAENGYIFDASIVRVGPFDPYASFLDRDLDGLVKYKIPKSWAEIEEITTDDDEYSSGRAYYDFSGGSSDSFGMNFQILTNNFDDYAEYFNLETSETLENLTARFICELAYEGYNDQDIATTMDALKTTELNGTAGVICKFRYSSDFDVCGMYASFWGDYVKCVNIYYTTDFINGEHEQELQLVLDSISIPKGISVDTDNGYADIKTENKDDVFGTLVDIVDGKTSADKLSAPTEQEKALKKAVNYLVANSFSYAGLVEQLQYEGFSAESSAYAADNCKADWNDQAASRANYYMNMAEFSKRDSIDQLMFEGFTEEQATYGANAV